MCLLSNNSIYSIHHCVLTLLDLFVDLLVLTHTCLKTCKKKELKHISSACKAARPVFTMKTYQFKSHSSVRMLPSAAPLIQWRVLLRNASFPDLNLSCISVVKGDTWSVLLVPGQQWNKTGVFCILILVIKHQEALVYWSAPLHTPLKTSLPSC